MYGCKCNCKNFREHALGVSFAASAMPSRSGEANRIDAAEKQFAKDGAAYRRLRAQGYQPKDVDGSAELETRASDAIEIGHGKVMGKELLGHYKAAVENIGEAG